MAKVDLNAPVTVRILQEAVDAILKGMDNMLKIERGFNMKTFATKEDLKQFATKEDLKREVSWVRDDIKGLTADLSGTVSEKEFNQLKTKVDKFLPA